MFKSLVTGWLDQAGPARLPEEVLIYGAGGAGKRVAGLLRSKKIRPLALLDRKALPDSRWETLPIQTPQAWRLQHPDGCRALVLAIHSPGHSLGGLVSELRAQGFDPVFTLVDLCNLYPDSFTDFFWLAPRTLYRKHLDALQALHERLSDDLGRETLLNILQFRLTGDYAALHSPEGGQYCPSSLPRWPERLRLIDCGAYTGDTLDAMRAAGYSIEAAACFEPDPENFRTLARNVAKRGTNALCIPCAVTRESTQLRFSAEGSGSSHLQQDGSVMVQAVSLDESLPAFAPNLIKMDIEGAEIEALYGARHLLASHRPGLAISLYHRAEHLWQIPEVVAELLPEHSLTIRSHAHNTFDVVLYARPLH